MAGENMNEEKSFDLIIIGGGPAGLSAAVYAARSGLKTMVLDSVWGGQAVEIAELENYPGVFPKISGPEYINLLKDQVQSFGTVMLQARALSAKKEGDSFLVETEKGLFKSKALILATGASHRKLNVPGETELTGRGVSYCAVCDGHFFKNRRVLVAGGGDSAFSQALYLSNICAHVDIVHRRDGYRAAASLIKRAEECENITLNPNYKITGIEGKFKVDRVMAVNNATGEEKAFETDGVFVFVGMSPADTLIEGLEKDSAGYVKVDSKMMTSIEGVFAAGDNVSKGIRQVVTAANDGAIAALSAFDYIKG